MNLFGCILILIAIGLPVAWLVSEFRSSRPVRISLGVVAMAVVTAPVAGLCTALTGMQYNADFGVATKELIEASIEQIEDGQMDRVLKGWRGLNAQYRPTYENRAGYPELAAEAAARIRGEKPFEAGTPWDARAFSVRTWVGHWENDTGYWIVVSEHGPGLEVWRSGSPPEKMLAASLTDDFRTLTFREGEQWRHTLTLDDKYGLTHEWFDLTQQAVWRTEPMYKLVRATEEQRRMTRRDAQPKR